MKDRLAAPADGLQRLMGIIETLRSPEGCLWDRSQGMADIGRYLLEEAYEVLDAIAADTPAALQEELGDLLFQILFLARMAEEKGDFHLADIMEGVAEKMIRRHPHVFGDVVAGTVGEIRENWEEIKRKEKDRPSGAVGLLEGLPRSMPALMRAQKLGERAARVGFDWACADDVLKKIREEMDELQVALDGRQPEGVEEEVGDILFAVVNWARLLQVNAEAALSRTLLKFSDRFAHIERTLATQGLTLEEATLQQMDALWEEAKRLKKG